MTEILLKQLSHDALDDVAKEQRDLYLELLEEHTLDSNAFVRSKVNSQLLFVGFPLY